MQHWLRTKRQKIEQDLHRSSKRWDFSPVFYAQYRVVVPALRRYVRGKTIDLGSGNAPFRDFLTDQVTCYDTLDSQIRLEPLTFVGDIQNMSMIATASYDSAMCIEVLEHVPDPSRAVGEIYRILKPGGTAVISVPHLSRLHEEPNDYFRFTRYGLRYLLENAGFLVLEIQRKGSLCSFLGHQVSTVLVGMVWSVPGLRQIVWFLNKWLVTRLCYGIDSCFDRAGIFALGYVGVVQKPGGGEQEREEQK